ncbi:MAG: hypothetical protein EBQ51_02275 [Verrucomicrobia bacterium]|nr:hypothetical protein [Verrucomicrobiota bacterium]NBS78486.1 hypothetical protein [bacterium]NBV96932.1 hypothetical protein [Verrucomicrobiota bacterium]NBY65895.1 hypothetical protein [Verrucomicrobiota bacterium]
MNLQPFWLAESTPPDTHALFRAKFRLARTGEVTVSLAGAHAFRTWIDGTPLDEGPARFPDRRPDYATHRIVLEAGPHVLAFHAHHLGVETRLQQAATPAFVAAAVTSGPKKIPLRWRAFRAEAYQRTGRRLGCVLGWVEWCQTAQLPDGWREVNYADGRWPRPRRLRPSPAWTWRPVDLGPIRPREIPAIRIGEGSLVNMSLLHHDPTAAFVTRTLHTHSLPAQGRWFRWDLGRVCLIRPRLHLRLPRGSVVQVAYAESLTHGRVSPYLKTGSGENSCMLDHWETTGGPQILEPLHPKGARFVEVHILAPCKKIPAGTTRFFERTAYPEPPTGQFHCSDRLLNRIWQVGVTTLRGCAEDAITDNPHRERGQWLGDAVGPAMDLIAAAYHDWRPLRRGLRQAAECAGPDGMVPGVFPGACQMLPSFALQWVAAIPRYHRLTGDLTLLRDLYPAAERNLRAFARDRQGCGVRTNPARWNFIDWGYQGAATVFGNRRDTPQIDPALSLLYLEAVQGMAAWAQQVGRRKRADHWRRLAQTIGSYWRARLTRTLRNGRGPSYHTSVLALRTGVLPPSRRPALVAAIRRHLLACFPNNPQAVRLDAPTLESTQVITPFFLHHALPALIREGQMSFVLEQIRTCWGWFLSCGFTTWPEVFDTRWSHCHQWSGCPTWILSRHLLGLHPRFDLGFGHYDLEIHPGGQTRVSGTIPFPMRRGGIRLAWKKVGSTARVTLVPDLPVVIHLGPQTHRLPADQPTVLSVPLRPSG